MPARPISRIPDTEADAARMRYREECARRNRELVALDHLLLVSRMMSAAQWADALAAEIDGLKAFIQHARLAGAEAPRILRDESLRLLFIDEARRRKGL